MQEALGSSYHSQQRNLGLDPSESVLPQRRSALLMNQGGNWVSEAFSISAPAGA